MRRLRGHQMGQLSKLSRVGLPGLKAAHPALKSSALSFTPCPRLKARREQTGG